MIKIQSITDPSWLEFIAKQENATIFHHPAWAEMLAECYGYQPFVLISLDEEGKVNGGIPLMDVNSKLTGRRWISLPFSDYCTPLSSTPAVLESLVGYMITQYKQKAIPRVEIHSLITSRSDVYQDNRYVMHTIKLLNDPDSVMKTFDKTRVRESIKKGVKRGVEIRWGTNKSDIFTFYEMLVDTRRRLGSPVQPKRFFDLLWDRIINKGLGFLLLAYSDGKPIGGVVYLHYKGILTGKYGASMPEYWTLRANHLLIWSGIKWGCEQGFTTFDFGRTDSSNQNLCDYKNGWGTVEEPLIYSTIADNKPGPKEGTGGRMQQLMAGVVQHSPAWVCRMIGELLYGHFA